METVRTHRVGSITTGFAFIAFGVMFILHLFLSVISYDVIFKLQSKGVHRRWIFIYRQLFFRRDWF